MLVKLERHRILVAADTRGGRSSLGQEGYTDDWCKIHSLGHTVFAIAGMVGHSHVQSGRQLLDWDALLDAKTAYRTSGDNTDALANQWGKLSAAHIAAYARSNPNDASREFAGLSGSIVYGGFFLNWVFGSPILKVDYVSVEGGGILSRETTLLRVAFEQSTNSVTQELVKGETQRAKKAAHLWKLSSHAYPPTEISWRHMQFLIEETSRFDHTVSPTSDIMEILDSGKVSWLMNTACGK